MNAVERLWDDSIDADGVALITPDGTVSRRALRERAARWRGDLAAAGIGTGDRVVVVAKNGELFVTAYLALLGLGAVTVPLNPQAPLAELQREVAAVAPRAAIVAPELTAPGGDGPSLDPQEMAGSDVLVIDVETLGRSAPMPSQPVPADAPAVLLFTSGTAGMPKPAVLTHANLTAAMASMVSLPVDLVGCGHIALAVIPLFHVFGLHTIVNLGLRIGATLVLDDYRSPEQIAGLVAEHEVTLLVGPPTMWQVLCLADGIEPATFTSVQLAISGAAKLEPRLRDEVAERLGLELDEGYGLTETCAVTASSVGTDAPAGSVGVLMPGIEARLVDVDGDDVLVDDPGEIWAKGPMVSPGYFTVEADGRTRIVSNRDEDGWLRTGDLAVVDDDGYLSIVDRVKDLVIVSGFNVYPGEVEVVLRQHPDVADAAVVGEDDPATGEALVAHVVLAPGAELEPEALTVHCRHHLARYKVPRRYELHQLLPRGLGGKMRRRDLVCERPPPPRT